MGAAPPAAAFVWLAVAHLWLGGAKPATATLPWASPLGIELSFRVDALSLIMALLVTGVGAVVLAYQGWYGHDEPGTARDTAVLVAFAGAMLGLVLADDIIGLYLFWELTTLCSFVLIGGPGRSSDRRRHAVQGLLMTTLGGFAMLLGLIMLGEAAGTWRLSGIVAAAPTGAAVDVALVLVLIGVLGKSAQLPLHSWLPAAMVAPTPVSAYLHAAAMVKAGVYLVARLAPGFASNPVFVTVVTVAGLASLLVGGYRALRTDDLKALLAYGTISQLGLLLVLLGWGTRTAALAGMALLIGHALFKSALFLTVGAIEKVSGSRSVRELSGVGRRWPSLAVGGALAAASMAGLPPLLGFVAKEAMFKAFLKGGLDVVVLVAIALGTVLTVAYSARFVWGAFATKPDVEGTDLPGTRPWQPVVAVALPAVLGGVLGFAGTSLTAVVDPYASALPDSYGYTLKLWHGLTPSLGLAALVLVTGYLLYRVTPTLRRLPQPLDAQRGYARTVHGFDALARIVTGHTQVGSLPVYLGVTLLTVFAVPAAVVLTGTGVPGGMRAWDRWVQLPLAVIIVLGCVGVLVARRRLTAVLCVGGAGYAIGALFVVHGAIDVALAQFLVETLTLVVFVLVLRQFPAAFSGDRGAGKMRARDDPRHPAPFRWLKATIAVVGGGVVAAGAVLLSGQRGTAAEASAYYLRHGKDDTGASNVVTAILVDYRAMDTIGEISVLAAAVTGAAGLILAATRAVRHFAPPRRGTDELADRVDGEADGAERRS
ncbi:hydrogen gas-evolving membrane-bound hydrogenase subunit E [Haloechinothrix salitolerans]|uniref:Hydrogen gas-evolving membrane-bound hydrogenase subunit E n=1 Tax=Haloechinothrix salitolerans TaxID=926830 RepID=A0ABW2C1S1_9PSEU